jgi:hypothetical protein
MIERDILFASIALRNFDHNRTSLLVPSISMAIQPRRSQGRSRS